MGIFTNAKSQGAADAVNHIRTELWDMLATYDLIRDCLCGERAVKAKQEKYLPVPNSNENDTNSARYKEYICRAVFYNVTERTCEGLVGQIFLRPPVVELPPKLEMIEGNANGEGITIRQVLQDACKHVAPFGRGAFMTDYTATDEPVTVAKVKAGKVQPTIKFYAPWDVINWETQTVQGQTILTMVVLREYFERREKGSFKVVTYERYRAFEIIDGRVKVTVMSQSAAGKEFQKNAEYELKDSAGFPFERIPVSPIGAENNDWKMDKPPLYAMSVLNIAHYRNSADYEETIYFLGQPTLFVNGLPKAWVEDVWDRKMQLGARGLIPAPPQSDAKLLQVEPNTLAKEGMDQKENQMIALGAKLVERSANVERKEKEIEIEAASDVSVLTKIASNVESAMLDALKFAAMFVGADPEGIKIELNRNFDLTSLTSEELRQLNEMNSAEEPLLARLEIRKTLERSGFTYLDDDEFELEIEKDQARKLANAQAMMEATTPPQPINPPTGGGGSGGTK